MVIIGCVLLEFRFTKLIPIRFKEIEFPSMADLDIQQQAIDLTSKVSQRIDSLNTDDPARPWFLVEFDKIAVSSSVEKNSLEENSARISALRQLLRLVFEHGFRKQNPHADTETEYEQSFLTVQARLPSNVLDSTRKLNFSIEPALLHEISQTNEQFDPVSPTAKVVSYLRSMDSSLSLFGESELNQQGKQILDELNVDDSQTKELMGVMFQSRYHALNVAIQQHNSAQVIEFASGVSPRGLQWSQNSPGTIYFESDLPQLMVRKAKLIRNSLMNAAESDQERGLLHCCGIDVLDEESILKALELIDPDQLITFASEGLLLYFGEEELGRFLTNIRNVLNRFPKAIWVSDLVSSSDLESFVSCHPGVANAVRSVFKMTGRSVVKQNPFPDIVAFEKFLNRFGLQIKARTPLSSTLGSINFEHALSANQMKKIVGERCVYSVMPLN